MRKHRATELIAALLALLCVALAALGLGAVAEGRVAGPPAAASKRAAPKAHAAASYLTGVGDEQTEMFGDPHWHNLHVKIARYIAPYDAVAHSYSLDKARVWIRDAEERHVQVLVAFYHSEYSPTRLPSVALYQHDVQKFVKLFPHVRQYQSWDEANRGNIAHVLSSPSPATAAQYYRALLHVCNHCTALGLDVLDQENISPTLRYISEFKREVSHLRITMPTLWGLHNYSDINRLESWRTRELSRAMGGQVWLTETGGIVQFGSAFPNNHGSGLRRASKVLSYMFSVAGSQSQIRRLYIYDWSGASSRTRFDAGLTDTHHVPRPGYLIVCRKLHGSKCSVKVSSH